MNSSAVTAPPYWQSIVSLFIVPSFLLTIHVTECRAIGNPAAIYCEAMGYQYTLKSDAQGNESGVCSFPDQSMANAWNFYRGKEGKPFSYCAKNGYAMDTDRKMQNGYQTEVSVCVSTKKNGPPQRTPMLDLMKERGDMPPARKLPRRVAPMPSTKKTSVPVEAANATYPDSLDWRDYNGHSYIGPIRDQGGCGSCYAFGAAAAAEGSYNVAHGKFDSECVDFSESYIAWCLGKYGPYEDHFSGCEGADYEYAELTALTVEGIASEASFPYTETDPGSCTHWDDPTVTFQEWNWLDSGNTAEIQRAITTYGVIDVAVNALSAFEGYSTGIFSDTQTTCPDDKYTVTNHAVALVGWGTDPTHGLYWILRNSWGSSWGEGGYMRIQAHSARVACSATYLAAEPVIDSFPWPMFLSPVLGGADSN